MSSPLIPPGQITAVDLFSVLEATRRDIQNVLTRVEVLDDRYVRTNGDIHELDGRLRVVEGKIPDGLTARLRALERWQWKAVGALAVVAIAVGVLSGWLGSVLGHAH